ncbi:hypothetical protein [Pontiella sp.]|uniref:hypothetical protein n=1 Tax=Pontiella sp. TaxID=2837462 RepID=UPI0035634614
MVLIPDTLGYVGPGAGLSALGALWALIASIGLALGVILVWPFRYLIRKIRGKGTGSGGKPETP